MRKGRLKTPVGRSRTHCLQRYCHRGKSGPGREQLLVNEIPTGHDGSQYTSTRQPSVSRHLNETSCGSSSRSTIGTPSRSNRVCRAPTSFRVRAWDWAGNVSAWAYGPTFAVNLAQETSTAWRWSTGWRRTAWLSASGGYVKLTGTPGAYGQLTFHSRSVALAGPRAASLRLSAIYLDGVRVATLNQWSSAAEARQPLYIRNSLSLTTTHVLEVRSLGQAGHEGGGTKVAVDVASIVG